MSLCLKPLYCCVDNKNTKVMFNFYCKLHQNFLFFITPAAIVSKEHTSTCFSAPTMNPLLSCFCLQDFVARMIELY